MKTFWNREHELSAESDRLAKELMPMSGNCQTIEGELYRASSRIGYDYYNNGFCNNWSGALAFLVDHDMVTVKEHRVLEPYQFGHRMDNGNFFEDDCPLQKASVAIHERVIRHILSKEELTPNTNNEDMFDYSLPEPPYDDSPSIWSEMEN
jgi:hypothetical protein